MWLGMTAVVVSQVSALGACSLPAFCYCFLFVLMLAAFSYPAVPPALVIFGSTKAIDPQRFICVLLCK